MQELFGDFDSNLRLLKERYSVKVYAKGLDVFVAGENQDVTAARGVLSNMLKVIRSEGSLTEDATAELMPATEQGEDRGLAHLPHFRPLTAGQEVYLRAMESHEVVLCHGPAG